MSDENESNEDLIKMLQSPDENIRYKACKQFLLKPLTPEAIKALRNIVNDPNLLVAYAAERALALHTSSVSSQEALTNLSSRRPSPKALSPEPLADAPMPSSSSQGIHMTTPELIQQNQLGLRREEHDWFQKWFEQITSRQIQLIQDLNQDLNQEIKVLNSIKSAVWTIVIILVLTGILMFINAIAIQAQGYGIF